MRTRLHNVLGGANYSFLTLGDDKGQPCRQHPTGKRVRVSSSTPRDPVIAV